MERIGTGRQVAAAALAASALAGCGDRQGPPAPARLVVGIPAGASTLLPNTVNEELTLWVHTNVFDTLVDLDHGLALRPGLAESWHTPDDTTWVFRLRPGVRFHDGRALEARHVAASLEHARSDPSSRRRVQLAFIKGIDVPDARTLVVRTHEGYDPVPVRLSTIFIWAPSTERSDEAVGSGAYRPRSWSAGQSAVLEAFEGGWKGRPPIAEVEFRVVPDPAERVRQLVAGSLHLLPDLPAAAFAEVAAAPGLRTAVENGLRVLFLGMDCARRASPAFPRGNPFHDRRVRLATALALDRQAIVKGPLGGMAEVVDQIASPQELGGHKGTVPPREHDPPRARKLLQAAGWGRGFDVTLDYMPKYRAADAVVEAVAADLARVGIRVTARPSAPPEFMPRVEARELAFYMLGWISDTGDGRVSYEYLIHSPQGPFGLDNGSGYSDPEVDRMIEAASRRLTPLERQALLSRLALKVYEDLPVIPLYRQADVYGVSKRLRFRPRLDRRMRAAEMSWTR